MKDFNKLFICIMLSFAAAFAAVNIFLSVSDDTSGDRPYNVEIKRLCDSIEKGESPDISGLNYITNVGEYNDQADFFTPGSDYAVREINGRLYRFDYSHTPDGGGISVYAVNISIVAAAVIVAAAFIFIKIRFLKPFNKLSEMPYELSKGNLTIPLEESRNKYFGKFLWGVNILRENMEQQKQRELQLQKEKQTTLLSISHDIKTPLSAIRLYSSALAKGLYDDREMQREISGKINLKVDEIERFIAELTRSAGEDFLRLEVNDGEFYLSEVMDKITDYYSEKLSLNKTLFYVGKFSDCVIKGDADRYIEILQNVIENAVKYGDGERIFIEFSDEEDCRCITVKNSGCTLPEPELVHIFDSFWRGSNSEGRTGSGLGLYICRQLARKMDGEIFGEINDSYMYMTIVMRKA
ncbi:MAG: sensor histidine kinase [Porcipelethomonas sp.]